MAKSVLAMSASTAAIVIITPSDRMFVETSNVYLTERSVTTILVGLVVTSPLTMTVRNVVVNVVQAVPSVM